jgi:dCTP deaminase
VVDGNLTIEPFDESNVEPASVDLRLGNDTKHVESSDKFPIVRTRTDTDESLVYHDIGPERFTIDSGDFVLATTKERVELPDDIVGEVLGRSSLGRLGISVHQTAGYIDPGFEGEITLELSNHGPAPVELHQGQRICQIVFNELSSPAKNPYGHDSSQYQGQTGATPSGFTFD